MEPIFQQLYSFIFDLQSGGYSATEMDRPVPFAIFIVNFDKVQTQLQLLFLISTVSMLLILHCINDGTNV